MQFSKGLLNSKIKCKLKKVIQTKINKYKLQILAWPTICKHHYKFNFHGNTQMHIQPIPTIQVTIFSRTLNHSKICYIKNHS